MYEYVRNTGYNKSPGKTDCDSISPSGALICFWAVSVLRVAGVTGLPVLLGNWCHWVAVVAERLVSLGCQCY